MITTNNNQTETNEIDEHLVREFTIYAENTSEIYFNVHIAWVKNYRKKQEKGIYDKDLALRGILNNYVPIVVRLYNKELGTDLRPTKADKEALAKELLQNVEDDIKNGVE